MVAGLVELIFIAAVAAAGFGLALPLRDREIRARWRALADRLGMEFEPGRLLESDGMAGDLGPYPVRIDNMRRQGTRVGVRVEVGEARIQPRHLWFFEGGERTDDAWGELDPRVIALLRQLGLARLFVLLLDAESEARLDAGIYSAHLGLGGGELFLTCPERIDDPEILGVVLGGLARLAEGLEDPEHIPRRLGENARAPGAPLRRKLICFQLLLEHFPESTECGRVAWSIGQAGRPTVETPEGLRLRLLALRHTSGFARVPELLPTLDEGLAAPLPVLRAVAVEATLGLTAEQAIPRLIAAARDRSAVVSTAAIRILGLVAPPGDARVEKVLLDLLYRGEAYARVDLVCTLALVGGPDALGPLMDLERVADPGIRRLSRHAIKRLQRRFPERQSGSLSLVGSGGELSPTGTYRD